MDPLGARLDIINAEEITRWSDVKETTDPLSAASTAMSILGPELPCVHTTPPFNIRPDLNQKVAFV